ncbi:hypothetical protein B0H17DRAFT_1152029 [Mycena rosella]|uniref:Uncharacterized protein n=1 Tax=Mycena rosella TaxID=1033263 RepID=A0AAD7BGQ6_MYCRO|nr:hypothetical protein B0H17DRAFT_1152029 [Mycena rosella]
MTKFLARHIFPGDFAVGPNSNTTPEGEVRNRYYDLEKGNPLQVLVVGTIAAIIHHGVIGSRRVIRKELWSQCGTEKSQGNIYLRVSQNTRTDAFDASKDAKGTMFEHLDGEIPGAERGAAALTVGGLVVCYVQPFRADIPTRKVPASEDIVQSCHKLMTQPLWSADYRGEKRNGCPLHRVIVKYKAIDREITELLAFICAKTILQNTSISGLCRDHCGKREIAKIQTRFHGTEEFLEGEKTVVAFL